MAYTNWTLMQSVLKEKVQELPASFADYLSSEPEEFYNIQQSLNTALADLTKQGEWSFRERSASLSVISGTQEYDAPAGKITNIKVSTNTTELDDADYATEIWGLTDTGEPTKYGFLDDKIVLYPIPDDSYTINYLYLTNNTAKDAAGNDKLEMSLEGDYPLIPEHCKHIITQLACILQYKKPNQARYVHWEEQYKSLLATFPKELQRDTSERVYFDTGIETNW